MSDLVQRMSDALSEVAYHEMALELGLTFMPAGLNRAQVPAHWDAEARAKARPYLAAALQAISESAREMADDVEQEETCD